MNIQNPPVIFHRKFKRPQVKVYRAADRGVRFSWNRYDTATIGCGVVLPTIARRPGAWCLSFVWRDKGRLVTIEEVCPPYANAYIIVRGVRRSRVRRSNLTRLYELVSTPADQGGQS